MKNIGISEKRRGTTIIEVVLVITVLSILSGMMWNAVDLTGRIPKERSIWRDIERISIAARLYRMEKGVLPSGMDMLEASGYIGKLLPPAGFQYGFVTGPRVVDGINKNAITVFAGTNKKQRSSVVVDYFGNPMEIIVLE